MKAAIRKLILAAVISYNGENGENGGVASISGNINIA